MQGHWYANSTSTLLNVLLLLPHRIRASHHGLSAIYITYMKRVWRTDTHSLAVCTYWSHCITLRVAPGLYLTSVLPSAGPAMKETLPPLLRVDATIPLNAAESPCLLFRLSCRGRGIQPHQAGMGCVGSPLDLSFCMGEPWKGETERRACRRWIAR